jgi:hypothetical protein
MLGIASLYVASLKAGRTALLRTDAVNLVNDMIDRIRANGAARDAYKLSAYGTGGPAMRNCTTGGNCSTDRLAEDDLATWVATTNDSLRGLNPQPGVEFFPGATSAEPDRYQVSLSWREAGEDQTFAYQASFEMLPVNP